MACRRWTCRAVLRKSRCYPSGGSKEPGGGVIIHNAFGALARLRRKVHFAQESRNEANFESDGRTFAWFSFDTKVKSKKDSEATDLPTNRWETKWDLDVEEKLSESRKPRHDTSAIRNDGVACAKTAEVLQHQVKKDHAKFCAREF